MIMLIVNYKELLQNNLLNWSHLYPGQWSSHYQSSKPSYLLWIAVMAFRRSNSRVDMFGNLVNTKHFDSELCAFMISVILVTWVSRSSQPGVPSDHQSGCPELDGRGAGQASPDRPGELRQGGDGRRPRRLQETFRQFCDAAGAECRLGQNWAAS